MAALGVGVARLSPQEHHTVEVIAIFDQARRGLLSADEAQAQLARCHAAGTCDGYWHGQPGMHSQANVLHEALH